MNNYLKKIFLLPSLILAQICLLAGGLSQMEGNSINESYSSKVKKSLPDEFLVNEETLLTNINYPDLSHVFNLSLILSSIVLCYLSKKKINFYFQKYHSYRTSSLYYTYKALLLFLNSCKQYANIVSFKKIHHCSYYKFYSYFIS